MAGKPKNRLELRRQYEAAEPLDPMEDEAEDLAEEMDDDDDAAERRIKKKKAAPKAKAKAKTVKPAKPAARMRIVWVVVNDAFKPLGTFDYSNKEAAETRAAELTAKGKGTHFVQRVKEPMPDDAPGLGASIPRPDPVATPARPTSAKGVEVAVEDDEELDDEDDEAAEEPGEDDDEE